MGMMTKKKPEPAKAKPAPPAKPVVSALDRDEKSSIYTAIAKTNGRVSKIDGKLEELGKGQERGNEMLIDVVKTVHEMVGKLDALTNQRQTQQPQPAPQQPQPVKANKANKWQWFKDIPTPVLIFAGLFIAIMAFSNMHIQQGGAAFLDFASGSAKVTKEFKGVIPPPAIK